MSAPLKDRMKMKTIGAGQWLVVPITMVGGAVLCVGVAVLLRMISHG